MDQVTQQNAAMVEEANAAAASLQTESADLARMVARFATSAAKTGDSRIEQSGRAPQHRPAPRMAHRPGGAALAVKAEAWDEF